MAKIRQSPKSVEIFWKSDDNSNWDFSKMFECEKKNRSPNRRNISKSTGIPVRCSNRVPVFRRENFSTSEIGRNFFKVQRRRGCRSSCGRGKVRFTGKPVFDCGGEKFSTRASSVAEGEERKRRSQFEHTFSIYVGLVVSRKTRARWRDFKIVWSPSHAFEGRRCPASFP